MIRTESGWCRPSPGQSAAEFAREFAESRPALTDEEVARLRAVVRAVQPAPTGRQAAA